MVSTLRVIYSYLTIRIQEKEGFISKKGCIMKGVMKMVEFYGGDGCVGHCRISRISQVKGSKK